MRLQGRQERRQERRHLYSWEHAHAVDLMQGDIADMSDVTYASS